ncbi:hypothetical protein B0H14DRAFT_2602705 [Mycena olivaceomarginata]|nr:hypothetical protein B0H14DRAFT_2602705 [Mycena olivaceomarginata]
MAPKLKGKIHGCSSPLEHATNVCEASFDIYLDLFHPNGSSYMSHGADDAIVKALGVDGEFGYASVDSRKVLCIHDPFPGVAIYRLDGTFHIEGSELKVRTREGHLTKTNLISLLAIPLAMIAMTFFFYINMGWHI